MTTTSQQLGLKVGSPYNMYRSSQQFRGGEGIVAKGVEATITNIGRLGRLGMRETDKEIIRIMTGQPPQA